MQQFINVSWITIVSGSSENIWYALATFELKINAMYRQKSQFYSFA